MQECTVEYNKIAITLFFLKKIILLSKEKCIKSDSKYFFCYIVLISEGFAITKDIKIYKIIKYMYAK